MGSYWVVTYKKGKKQGSYKLPGKDFKNAEQVQRTFKKAVGKSGTKLVSIKKVTPRKPRRRKAFSLW